MAERRERQPIEPDPGNDGEGNGTSSPMESDPGCRPGPPQRGLSMGIRAALTIAVPGGAVLLRRTGLEERDWLPCAQPGSRND